ncbi:hypothetical protein Plec18167_001038 [Paecilomyces lecythidis]|uniref:Uncharacterized protein n=1 Tax=Paecilomyces lecythidis TaxID=3004212 RepID=A0ABR3YDL9_9EURO
MHNNNRSFRALSPSPMTDMDMSLRSFTFASHARTTSDCSSVSPSSSPISSPTASPTTRFRSFTRRMRSPSSTTTDSRSRSGSPFTLRSAMSRRPSAFFLRRRPSAVDLALSEERSRCDEDTVERSGLALMEPRPVDPVPAPVGFAADIFGDLDSMVKSTPDQTIRPPQPRFVLGGIFEVMEGRA